MFLIIKPECAMLANLATCLFCFPLNLSSLFSNQSFHHDFNIKIDAWSLAPSTAGAMIDDALLTPASRLCHFVSFNMRKIRPFPTQPPMRCPSKQCADEHGDGSERDRLKRVYVTPPADRAPLATCSCPH